MRSVWHKILVNINIRSSSDLLLYAQVNYNKIIGVVFFTVFNDLIAYLKTEKTQMRVTPQSYHRMMTEMERNRLVKVLGLVNNTLVANVRIVQTRKCH